MGSAVGLVVYSELTTSAMAVNVTAAHSKGAQNRKINNIVLSLSGIPPDLLIRDQDSVVQD